MSSAIPFEVRRAALVSALSLVHADRAARRTSPKVSASTPYVYALSRETQRVDVTRAQSTGHDPQVYTSESVALMILASYNQIPALFYSSIGSFYAPNQRV